jgi:hypothetical protein
LEPIRKLAGDKKRVEFCRFAKVLFIKEKCNGCVGIYRYRLNFFKEKMT